MALGRAACDTVVWRHRGEVRVTVIAKATFAMVPDKPMRWAATEPIREGVEYHGNIPNRSVRATSERAPFLARADVVLVGHACSPGGVPAHSLDVRLAVLREAPLLDKRILVRGDGEGREAFQRMPLTYELAFGGIGSPDNPLGMGFATKQSPNLVDPTDAAAPACFAPLSRAWPLRRRALGKVSQRALDAPVMDIPEHMDWSYFQAAPPDQRIDHLRGDEWVLMEGMHPKYTSLRSQLPMARGMARVHGPFEGSPWRSIALNADTLYIDADMLLCTVVWRASFPIADEATLPALWVLAGVETSWGAIEWEAEPEMLDSMDLVDLEDEESVPLTVRPSLSRTIEVPALGPADKAVVPFRKGAAVVPAVAAPARRRFSVGDTVEIAPQTSAPRSLPFARGRRPVDEVTLVTGLTGAAPTALSAPPNPAVAGSSGDESLAAAKAPPPTAGALDPPRAALASEPAAERPAVHWAAARIETAPEEPVVMRQAAPKKKDPPAIDRMLYGRFTRRG